MSTPLNQIQDIPRAVGRALIGNHSRAVGWAMASYDASATGGGLVGNHSRAVSATPRS